MQLRNVVSESPIWKLGTGPTHSHSARRYRTRSTRTLEPRTLSLRDTLQNQTSPSNAAKRGRGVRQRLRVPHHARLEHRLAHHELRASLPHRHTHRVALSFKANSRYDGDLHRDSFDRRLQYGSPDSIVHSRESLVHSDPLSPNEPKSRPRTRERKRSARAEPSGAPNDFPSNTDPSSSTNARRAYTLENTMRFQKEKNLSCLARASTGVPEESPSARRARDARERFSFFQVSFSVYIARANRTRAKHVRLSLSWHTFISS